MGNYGFSPLTNRNIQTKTEPNQSTLRTDPDPTNPSASSAHLPPNQTSPVEKTDHGNHYQTVGRRFPFLPVGLHRAGLGRARVPHRPRPYTTINQPAFQAFQPSVSRCSASRPCVFHGRQRQRLRARRGATLAQLLAFLGAPTASSLADLGRRVTGRVLASDDRIWVDAFRHVAAESYRSEAQTVSFARKVRRLMSCLAQTETNALLQV